MAECLGLQLKERDRLDPAMQALLDNLPLLARRDMGALKRACGVDDDDLRDMVSELKALTPRPGAAFGAEPVQPVTPDVFVREDGTGYWRVDLNSDTLPRLLVDSATTPAWPAPRAATRRRPSWPTAWPRPTGW